ncbi:hypothetical protein BpHYR1_025866 [Brachionus plicatilis]|uniref:Uncharacterized protein n=1 Tax=Brachionus plicatilis TaxID=10195 RepID=A0A3M7SXB9_BRAPC|nr:hypothetical protein BpHYR1_025866 [Brachionus plicatilis]
MSGVTTSSITKHGSDLPLTWKFDSAVFTTSLRVGCSNTEKKIELSLSQMPSLSVMICEEHGEEIVLEDYDDIVEKNLPAVATNYLQELKRKLENTTSTVDIATSIEGDQDGKPIWYHANHTMETEERLIVHIERRFREEQEGRRVAEARLRQTEDELNKAKETIRQLEDTVKSLQEVLEVYEPSG